MASWAGWLQCWKLGTLLADRNPQVAIAESNGHRTVAPLFHPHHSASEPGANVLAGDLVDLPTQLDGVIVVYSAAFHMAENGGQIVLLLQRPMGVVGTG